MKLLLHACCGPCSLEPTRILREAGHDITIDYQNPNIHPGPEYEHRLQTIKAWTDDEGIELLEGEYDPDTWEREVGIYGTDRRARCRACYRLRLERTAARAAELGFEGISTTLSVSPYQLTDVIAEELERAAKACGLEAVFEDFRPNYPEATRRSRALGMYRQNYCGCRFSDVEAAEERAARKAARAAAQAAKFEARAAAEAAEKERRAAKLAEQQAREAKNAAKRAARDAARAARKAEKAEAGDKASQQAADAARPSITREERPCAD